MKVSKLLISSVFACSLVSTVSIAEQLEVNITKTLPGVDVIHKGKKKSPYSVIRIQKIRSVNILRKHLESVRRSVLIL